MKFSPIRCVSQRREGGLQIAMRPLLAFAFSCLLIGIPLAQSEGEREWWTLPITKSTKGLHIPLATSSLRVAPAFEDYVGMLMDICHSMKIPVEKGECLVFPLMTMQLSAGAIATSHEGQNIIVYDRTLSPKIGYPGAMGVVAHELGHHYCRHLERPPSPTRELEADKFAGAALRLGGYSLEQALAMTSILSERPSRSHPGRADRTQAIKDGWNNPETAKSCR